MFGARFRGLSMYFLYQKGNLIRIKTGLDTYLIRIQTRTPLSRCPPYDYSKICQFSVTLGLSLFLLDFPDLVGDFADLSFLFLFLSQKSFRGH